MISFPWRPAIISLFILSTTLFAKSSPVHGYKNQRALTNELKRLTAQHPNLITVESLAQTTNKHNLWLVTLGSDADDNPAIAMVGNVEADDVASSEICLTFLEFTAASYGTIDSVTALLDQYTFYIMPRINPDATEQLWRRTSFDRLLNAHDVDLDHDGAVSEDGFDDLNGDGVISWMRISDPAGEWMVDPHNPLLMRKADAAKNESGAFSLMREGIDNDNDGFWNEDPPGGVDVNRNFSFNYKPFEPGVGPHAVSEIETRAIADFLFAHPNIAAVLSFSRNENLLHPWPAAKEGQVNSRNPITAVLPSDAKLYDYISEEFTNITNLKDAPEPQRGHGNFSDWAYYHYGRWSFAAPSWWPPKIENADSTIKPIKNAPLEYEKRLYDWLVANNLNDFIEWSVIDHPDFPDEKVEVGGFLPGTMKNPPIDSLYAIAEKYSAFIYRLAALLPTLELVTKVEALDDQVYRVTATIKNNGFLPTTGELGSQSQWVQKVKAELHVQDGQQIISGNRFYLIDAIPGAGAQDQTWLIMGKKESRIKVVVGSPTVGSVTKNITLK